MQEKATDELNDMLDNIKPNQLDDYFKVNEEYMLNEKKAFYYYMKDVLDEKRIKLKDVYSLAGVTESYGSKILTMRKHTKDRNLIIRFCIAGHFDWDETNRALKLYGFNELYSKDPRDAVLIVAINNRVYNLYDIDEMLQKHGLERLTTE